MEWSRSRQGGHDSDRMEKVEITFSIQTQRGKNRDGEALRLNRDIKTTVERRRGSEAQLELEGRSGTDGNPYCVMLRRAEADRAIPVRHTPDSVWCDER